MRFEPISESSNYEENCSKMYCPSCGCEERETNQFCRACGSNMNVVRGFLDKPDSITDSAALARGEIGRAVAAKINEIRSAKDLNLIISNVLPEIDKFLEAPEEKKLRRLREGVVTGSIGIGLVPLGAILNLFIGMPGLVVLGAGLLLFFIGLGIFLSGKFLTLPNKSTDNRTSEANRQRELDRSFGDSNTNDLLPADENTPRFASVIENTTRQLTQKSPTEGE